MKSGLHPECKDCRHVLPERSTARSRFIDRRGQRFGRLVVVEFAGQAIDAKGRPRLWRCLCDCGTEAVFNWKQLKANHAHSCGCLRREHLATIRAHNALPEGESAFRQLFYAYQKSARERGHSWALSADEFRQVTQGDCSYCGAAPQIKFRAAKGTRGDYIGNGVDRVDSSRGYVTGNVRSCCTSCNVAKASMTEGEFAAWVARVYAHFAARFEHGEKG